MLQCIVIDFFLNNQPDALIIPISFCYKTLHVSGIFSAHHQEFSTVHSAMVNFMQVSDDGFQAESHNITQLISRFACLYLKKSKCSKWQDGNFTNNSTLLILFILFHDCWNIQMCWMYGCAFKTM